MSDMNRLRELAALLRPMPIREARVKNRTDLDKKFKALEEGVDAALKDLMFELGEGGALETMMDDVGVSDHKDAKHIISGVQAAADKLKKEVSGLMMEAEGLLFSAMTESRDPEPVNEAMKVAALTATELKNKYKNEDVIAAFEDETGQKLSAFTLGWIKIPGYGKRAIAYKGTELSAPKFFYDVDDGWQKTPQIELMDRLTEMAAAEKFRGGAFNRKEAKNMIAQFKGGEETFDLKNGDKYRANGKVSGGALKKGDIVFATHDQYNTGAELYQVLGFGKDDNVKFDSVKAAYAATGAKTLKALEDWNDKNDKDEVRLIVRDLDNGDEGDFFYVFQGRWAYGSGGEALTFIKVEKV